MAHAAFHKPRRSRRAGSTTKAEKELVARVVLDQPREVSPRQIHGLAIALRRPKEVIRALVEEAKEHFVANASDYVRIHKQATDQALENGENDIAAKAAQWAMEHLSAEGVRIVEPKADQAAGNRIQIGIKLGGIGESQPPPIVVHE